MRSMACRFVPRADIPPFNRLPRQHGQAATAASWERDVLLVTASAKGRLARTCIGLRRTVAKTAGLCSDRTANLPTTGATAAGFRCGCF